MRKKQVFGKYGRLFALLGAGVCRPGFNQHRQRQSGQLGIGRPGVAVKRQRHQPGTGLNQAQAKLAGQAVAKISRADFWDRQPARGHYHLRRFYQSFATVNLIASGAQPIRVNHAFDATSLPTHYLAGDAFRQQHVDEVFRRMVAKQLAFVLFMKGNAVALQQFDEVLRRVARQGRATKMRVLAEELRGCRALVGEVAAAAARDTDFLGHFGTVVNQQNFQAALARLRSAEQPRRASTYHHHIEFMNQISLLSSQDGR